MGFRQPEPSMKRKRGEEATAGSPLIVKRQKLLASRQNLPIWKRRRDIQDAIRDHDVLVLSGETGSGKSTQVPQFITDVFKNGKIAVTQPRRVAAISLARRVADEMGTPCGSASPASKVGYSVRFDQSTSPNTRIKFLTEGMLLQEILRDPKMKQYSTVIIDEVHERSVNVDLILGFLKQLLSERRKGELKVIIMSATADVEGLAKFFTDSQPSWPNKQAHHDDLTHDGPESRDPVVSRQGVSGDNTTERQISVATCHVEGRQYPVDLQYLDEPTENVDNIMVERVKSINEYKALPGDILVFMTGQEAIQGLQKRLEEEGENLKKGSPRLLVLPLFAALSQSAQQLIFEPAPKNTRKVILSTNIAETSVTVPGVRFVIDSGKAKMRQFRSQIGLDSLLVRPVSKSSADQRKGRAGREAKGTCFRLYTKEAYQAFDKDNKPEILRCDLSEAVLNMKARGVEDVINFPFLDPPSSKAMERALLHLLRLGALEEDGSISKVGRQVARLPLSPSQGRVIVEAARYDCLPEIIDIIACLSEDNIFINTNTEETREQAQAARSQLFRRQGDHLTMLAAVRGYALENSDRRRWADDHLISHRAMKAVMAVRKQLRAHCKSAKLLSQAMSMDDETATPSEETSEHIIKALLRGFIDNVARLCPDGSYKTLSGNHTVAIHPSSVLYGRKVELMLYNEFVYTTKAYARGVSVVQTKWLEDVYDTLRRE